MKKTVGLFTPVLCAAVLMVVCSACTAPLGRYAASSKRFLAAFRAAQSATLFTHADCIAQDLVSNLNGFDLEDDTLIVTTFSRVHDLQETTDFGRTLTDCMISALQKRYFRIVELRKTKQLHVEEKNGEYMLSRRLSEISSRIKSRACMVGTYSIAYDRVIVNARIVDMADGSVLSSCAREMRLDRNIRRLLAQELPPAADFKPGVTVFERPYEIGSR
ncbi:MAG: hypothetical protein GY868_02775 [Deltaproteobacteria bacterium]|nr:hypothetical protein [Deltaproteobacteria bacterium]